MLEYSLETNKRLSWGFLFIHKSVELIYRWNGEPRPAANLDRRSISIYFMSRHFLYAPVLSKIAAPSV